MQVTPESADLFVAHEEVVQDFIVTNTESDAVEISCTLVEVTLTPSGELETFTPIQRDDIWVSPEKLMLASKEDGTCSVHAAPETVVGKGYVFGLLAKRKLSGPGVSDAILRYIFLDDGTVYEKEFRIDAFSVKKDAGHFIVRAQMTHVAGGVLRPTTFFVIRNSSGDEMYRSIFAPLRGRIPVGTTRIIEDRIPHYHEDFWSFGGVRWYSLESVEGDFSTSAKYKTYALPGAGVLTLVFLLFFSGFVFTLLRRRRGILST